MDISGLLGTSTPDLLLEVLLICVILLARARVHVQLPEDRYNGGSTQGHPLPDLPRLSPRHAKLL